MLVKSSGKIIGHVRPLQLWKALSSIVVKPSLKVRELRLVQPEKALLPDHLHTYVESVILKS